MSTGNGKSAGLSKGDAIFIPADVWPNEKPPKGKKGWTGSIVGQRSLNELWIKFPDDANKYFFKKSELEKWASKYPVSAPPAKASTSVSPKKKPAKAAKASAPAVPARAAPPPQQSRSLEDQTTSSDLPPRSPSTRESLISEIYELLHSIPLADLRDLRNQAKTYAGL